MTIIKTIRKCVEGMILNDIISILLFCAFAYLFNFNFHRDNYAYCRYLKNKINIHIFTPLYQNNAEY